MPARWRLKKRIIRGPGDALPDNAYRSCVWLILYRLQANQDLIIQTFSEVLGTPSRRLFCSTIFMLPIQ